MARPTGSRAKEFEARRGTLLVLARQHLSQPAGRRASWRDLAAACGVSPSTLAHYFGDRDRLIAAILAHARSEGEIYLARAARPSGPFPDSIRELVALLGQGLDRGVMALQIIGITEGLASPGAATAYLGEHLEPVLGAIAARLAAHAALGEIAPLAPRFAAIGLLAPMLVARLHQSELGGHASHPLSLPAFDAAHADAFIRAHQPA